MNYNGTYDRNDRRHNLDSLGLIGKILVSVMIVIAPWWVGSVGKLPQLVMAGLAVAGLGVWWLELSFTRVKRQYLPLLAILVAGGVLLGTLQLLPLPPGIAQTIAGPQQAMIQNLGAPLDGEAVSGLSEAYTQTPSTRLTLYPEGTAHFVQLLVVGLICVLLTSHFFAARADVNWVAGLLAVQGIALGLFAIYQQLNSNGKIYWIIELTKGGTPFGPYVNRNNAGGYLLMCLAGAIGLAFLAFTKNTQAARPRPLIGSDYPIVERLRLRTSLFLSELNASRILSATLVIGITVSILFCLSRGAITGLIVGSLVTLVVVGVSKYQKAGAAIAGIAVLFTLVLVGWLRLGERLAAEFDSFNDKEQLMAESRFELWQESLRSFSQYPILGYGLNAYRHAFRSIRDIPEYALNEYAENQYVQTLAEAGLVGILLLVGAIGLLICGCRYLLVHCSSRKTAAAAAIGVFALASQLVAASFDFGLYMPANMLLMAFLAGFVGGQVNGHAERMNRKSWQTVALPRWLIHPLLLLLLVAGSLVAFHRYGQWRVEQASVPQMLAADYRTLPLADCEQHIANLESAVQWAPSASGFKQLGELYLHRCRLQLLDRNMESARFAQWVAADPEAAPEHFWTYTSLAELHRQVWEAVRSGDREQLRTYLTDPPIKENLPQLRASLLAARYRDVFDAGVHLMLARCQVFAASEQTAAQMDAAEIKHLQRAVAISPLNFPIRQNAGITHLHAGRFDAASENLREASNLVPARSLQLARYALAVGMSREEIAKQILPTRDSAEAAAVYLKFVDAMFEKEAENPLKQELLAHADQVLNQLEASGSGSPLVHAEVKLARGDIPAAITLLESALRVNPGNIKIRRDLLGLYEAEGLWEQAKVQCEWLLNETGKSHFKNRLIRITDMIDKPRAQ